MIKTIETTVRKPEFVTKSNDINDVHRWVVMRKKGKLKNGKGEVRTT